MLRFAFVACSIYYGRLQREIPRRLRDVRKFLALGINRCPATKGQVTQPSRRQPLL